MHKLIRGGWFGRQKLERRLWQASHRLREFCQRFGKRTALRKFTQDNLNLKSGKHPVLQMRFSSFPCFFLCNVFPSLVLPSRRVTAKELHAKGYDSYIILEWLSSELEQCADDSFTLMATMVWCAQSFARLLNAGPAFFCDEMAAQVRILGESFCKLYVQHVHLEPKVWKIRPKFHLVVHLALDAQLRKSRRNPAQDSTWGDEDWIKKIARMVRKTHRKTTAKRGLQRYLLLLKQKFVEQKKR